MSQVKHDRDDERLSTKLVKSPKDSQLFKPNSNTIKVKKEIVQVKKESESPAKKNLLHKKPLETSSKHSETVRTVIARKEVEKANVAKKEPRELNKEKAGQTVGKVKVMKKEEVRGRTASSNAAVKKKKVSKGDADKKEKKVYDLPGQKHDPPEERDPLRIFYESLYRQNPKSEMAEVWMMEHGLLAFDAAKRALERRKKNQLSQKMSSPVKSVKNAKVERVASKSATIQIEKENFHIKR